MYYKLFTTCVYALVLGLDILEVACSTRRSKTMAVADFKYCSIPKMILKMSLLYILTYGFYCIIFHYRKTLVLNFCLKFSSKA